MSIIIKHSFKGQILIDAFERRILINVNTIVYTMIFNYNQGPGGRYELELLFLVISILQYSEHFFAFLEQTDNNNRSLITITKVFI
jgi:hypothetical protein